MPSYLDSYAAIEERKARNRERLKRGAIATVCVVVVALFLYFIFKNRHQEQQVKIFLQHLQSRQYQEAYSMWGCTGQTPCRDYAFPKFMEDWGPNSPHANAAKARMALSQSCGNSAFIRLEYPQAEAVALMVDKNTEVISFAPSDWIECPGPHWHFWEFIKGLFRA
jgi:hypothetical protein